MSTIEVVLQVMCHSIPDIEETCSSLSNRRICWFICPSSPPFIWRTVPSRICLLSCL